MIEVLYDKYAAIDTVRRLLKDRKPGGPRLKITRDCTTTDFQFKNYMWKAPLASGEHRTKPEVVKKHDEHPDCACMWAHVNRNQLDGPIKEVDFGVKVYGNG
jgi:hypothetical protein